MRFFLAAVYLTLVMVSAFTHEEELFVGSASQQSSSVILAHDGHCGDRPSTESQDVGHCSSCHISHCPYIVASVFLLNINDFDSLHSLSKSVFSLLNYQYGQFRPPIQG